MPFLHIVLCVVFSPAHTHLLHIVRCVCCVVLLMPFSPIVLCVVFSPAHTHLLHIVRCGCVCVVHSYSSSSHCVVCLCSPASTAMAPASASASGSPMLRACQPTPEESKAIRSSLLGRCVCACVCVCVCVCVHMHAYASVCLNWCLSFCDCALNCCGCGELAAF